MLAHPLRRWPSIKPALVQRLVFAGMRSIARWSVKCWASVAGACQYPFSPSQYCIMAGMLAHSIHRPMPFKCWPASYIMTLHQTNARYTDTLAASRVSQYPFSPSQYSMLAEIRAYSIHRPNVISMLASIGPASDKCTLHRHMAR